MSRVFHLMVATAILVPGGSILAQLRDVPPLDRTPPVMPNGAPVAAAPSAAGGDAMCWGDPSGDGRVVTGEFGEMRGHVSSPHAGVDFRARSGNPIYAVADGCVSFGNPTPKQLIGVKQRINDRFPNASVWYLHMSRVAPKFINDGRAGQCIPARRGELIGYSGSSYGTGGREVESGTAHLHLSYFVSGLMLNPTPYIGAPSSIPLEFNTVKSVNDIVSDVVAGEGNLRSKLGFGVPRMCSTYLVKDSGKQTIPYNGNFGTGTYAANATAPTQTALAEGQQRVRQAMGIGIDGRGDGPIGDSATWSGGLPEEPDWESYSQMSYDQIMQAESARRVGNPRWAEQLTEQSDHGLTVEMAWIKGLRLKVQEELLLSRRRSEAMYAALLASRMRRVGLLQTASAPVNNRPAVR